ALERLHRGGDVGRRRGDGGAAGDVAGVVQRALLDVRQDARQPAPAVDVARAVAVAGAGVGGEEVVVVVVGVDGDAQLLEVVLAGGGRGRLTHLLDGRQQQADQHGDDGDDDEQLDQRERRPTTVPHGVSLGEIGGRDGATPASRRGARSGG